jgi:hypothetical protein
VKPVEPYSIFQAVSVPPAVHDKSALLVDILEIAKALGVKQEGAEIHMLSINELSPG